MRPHLKHYQVVGRATPTEAEPTPTVYKFEVFAPNFVVAKSKFWTLMNEKNKVKSTKGDILSCKVVKDRKLAARNYSVDLAYYSQACGFTQMTKEFRDVSRAGAVSQAYNDLASKHRARYHSIDVLGVKSIDASSCRRAFVAQFNNGKLAFPLLHRRVQPNRKDRAIFKAKQSTRTL